MATELRAPARPPTYAHFVELGWRWYVRFGSPTPHLCPPAGDMSLCLTVMTRAERRQVSSGIAAGGCKRCKLRAGLS